MEISKFFVDRERKEQAAFPPLVLLCGSKDVENLFEHIHQLQAFIISVDFLSGLFTDILPSDEKADVKTNHKLTFQVHKLIFFLPVTGRFTYQWEVLDIVLDAKFLSDTETDYELIGKNEVLSYYN